MNIYIYIKYDAKVGKKNRFYSEYPFSIKYKILLGNAYYKFLFLKKSLKTPSRKLNKTIHK